MQIERLGPYQIRRKLGRGGMGTVYEGVHAETGEAAAVKLLSATMADDADFRHRFQAEIETLRKLNHPNIVRLFGFGEEDEHLFYAMELVAGSSLEEELNRGRTFTWRDVTRIGMDLARALRHAHDRGVIHRDIKPGNLLLTADGQVKLSDFGIARLFGSGPHTSAGSVLGTAEFMSPEQAEGRPVGPRSDLYSLGGVLYTLLARRPLFRGKSLPELLLKQRFEAPAPLAELAPEAPAELQQIVMQLLSKDPEQRIPNATVLLRRLEAMDRTLSLAMPATATESPRGVETDPPAPPAAGAPAEAAGEGVAPPPVSLPPTLITENVPPLDSAVVLPLLAGGGPPDSMATAAFEKPATAAPVETLKPSGRFTRVGEEDLDQPEPPAKTPYFTLSGAILAFSLRPSVRRVGGSHNRRRPTPCTTRSTRGCPAARLSLCTRPKRTSTCFSRGSRAIGAASGFASIRRRSNWTIWSGSSSGRARGLGTASSLLPVEQAYVEASDLRRGTIPTAAWRSFAHLIDLFDDGKPRASSDPLGQCLKLAKRQLGVLQKQFDASSSEQLDDVLRRLDDADRIGGAEPERAEGIYRAVVELYGHKPWAAEAVRRARAALDRLRKPSPPAAKPGTL